MDYSVIVFKIQSWSIILFQYFQLANYSKGVSSWKLLIGFFPLAPWNYHALPVGAFHEVLGESKKQTR